jgi:hypothetical protein
LQRLIQTRRISTSTKGGLVGCHDQFGRGNRHGGSCHTSYCGAENPPTSLSSSLRESDMLPTTTVPIHPARGQRKTAQEVRQPWSKLSIRVGGPLPTEFQLNSHLHAFEVNEIFTALVEKWIQQILKDHIRDPPPPRYCYGHRSPSEDQRTDRPSNRNPDNRDFITAEASLRPTAPGDLGESTQRELRADERANSNGERILDATAKSCRQYRACSPIVSPDLTQELQQNGRVNIVSAKKIAICFVQR